MCQISAFFSPKKIYLKQNYMFCQSLTLALFSFLEQTVHQTHKQRTIRLLSGTLMTPVNEMLLGWLILGANLFGIFGKLILKLRWWCFFYNWANAFFLLLFWSIISTCLIFFLSFISVLVERQHAAPSTSSLIILTNILILVYMT